MNTSLSTGCTESSSRRDKPGHVADLRAFPRHDDQRLRRFLVAQDRDARQRLGIGVAALAFAAFASLLAFFAGPCFGLSSATRAGGEQQAIRNIVVRNMTAPTSPPGSADPPATSRRPGRPSAAQVRLVVRQRARAVREIQIAENREIAAGEWNAGDSASAFS